MENNPDSACQYDLAGNLLNPGCSVEKLCRDHETFGNTYCMRDHYYQLWDLEKNFGEKMMCNDRVPTKMNANKKLENALMGGPMARKFSAGVDAKPSEKPTDKFGYALGVESSPIGSYINDCCVLNFDEKQGFLSAIQRRLVPDPTQVKSCGGRRIKRFGQELPQRGGICKMNKAFLRQGKTLLNLP